MRPFPMLLVLAAVATSGVILVGAAPRPSTGTDGPRERSALARDGSGASAEGVADAAVPTGFFGAPEGLRPPSRDQDPDSPLPEIREFFFSRVAYTSWRSSFGGGYGRRGEPWSTDYPKADRQFMVVLKRLTNLDGYDYENALRLDDPDIRRFPFLYALEVGYMDLTEPEVHGLRDYLNAGGFLVIDDFWGLQEYANFEYQMARVLPGREIVDLPIDHPLFSTFYDITEVRQTPAIGRGVGGRPTWERSDAKIPMVKGIYDDQGRLMVVIN